MKRNSRYLLYILMVCACAMLAAEARVFMRYRTAAANISTLISMGGTLAYETEININGGEGHLAVFGFDSPHSEIKSNILAAYKGGKNESNLITIEESGISIKLLTVNISPAQTVVFSIEQDQREARESAQSPKAHMMRSIPAYPGSTPIFFASDSNSSFDCAVSSAIADQGSIRAFYKSQLASTGWKQVIPTTKTSSLDIFLKNNSVSCISVEQKNDTSRITLLHKEGKIK